MYENAIKFSRLLTAALVNDYWLQLQSIRLGDVDIKISTEALCLGVLLDSAPTFAPHARRLCSKSFYHLRQIKTVRKSLTGRCHDLSTRVRHLSSRLLQ